MVSAGNAMRLTGGASSTLPLPAGFGAMSALKGACSDHCICARDPALAVLTMVTTVSASCNRKLLRSTNPSSLTKFNGFTPAGDETFRLSMSVACAK